MKAITCTIQITGASSRADGSLGLRLATPELKPEEKTVFFELLNQNLRMLLQPEGTGEVEIKEVKSQFDEKTPGQRLRAVLFIAWKQRPADAPAMDFEVFYRGQMETLIESVKATLNPES